MIAKKWACPIDLFIAATNSNDVFTNYLSSGIFETRKSVQTYSNAMDVGNPSNLERMRMLYEDNIGRMRNEIESFSFDDEKTVIGIKEVYSKYNYVIDPHGAVGYLALKKFLGEHKQNKIDSIVIETAHPAKFKDVVENTIKTEVKIPPRLAECLNKEKHSIVLDSKFETFKRLFVEYPLNVKNDNLFSNFMEKQKNLYIIPIGIFCLGSILQIFRSYRSLPNPQTLLTLIPMSHSPEGT